jgi:hypothetical protein
MWSLPSCEFIDRESHTDISQLWVTSCFLSIQLRWYHELQSGFTNFSTHMTIRFLRRSPWLGLAVPSIEPAQRKGWRTNCWTNERKPWLQMTSERTYISVVENSVIKVLLCAPKKLRQTFAILTLPKVINFCFQEFKRDNRIKFLKIFNFFKHQHL